MFGVSRGDYLGYALKNRQKWELKGQEAVAEMIERILSQEEEINKECGPTDGLTTI